MSRYHSYLNSAKEILQQYKGGQPFASFLKQYFAANKRFGSKDRKQVSHLCYCYFRLGKAMMNVPVEERILAGLFLCSNEANEILEVLKPEWNAAIGLGIEEKCLMLARRNFSEGGPDTQFSISNVFPWKNELSAEVEHEKFCESFFIQPDLFIRIRPGHTESVLLKLDSPDIEYEFISPFTVRLPNSFKADQYFELDKEVVVQDYSSQRIAEFLPVRRGLLQKQDRLSDRVWDCCAGSGGKSIMAFDINPKIELTVSDVRESILANFKKRFEKAGINKYKSALLDLSKQTIQHSIFNTQFSIIIADLPCTGSGTWSRTPEQLYYFDKKKIDEYVALQKKIVSTVIPHIEPGGHLLYITCSVFKKENEQVVEFIKEKFQLQQVKMELLKGYDKKADTMFAALLRLPE